MLQRLFKPLFNLSTASVAPEQLEMRLAGAMRVVLIRRNAKTRRYTLRLKPGTRELVVTMPPRGSIISAKDFLTRHEGWIAERFKRLPEHVRFENEAIIPYKGVEHRIIHKIVKRGTVWLDIDETSPVLAVAGNLEHLPRRVRDFLKKNAKQELEAASQKYAAKLDVTIKRVTIKDTTSRWGSCSSQGAISYSWRIIMAPPYVLDYLAAHEVTHRREMNHSPRFWKLLQEICPDTDLAEAWLKKHGRSLHNYG
jgi:predicted metal-dependent hydrolase